MRLLLAAAALLLPIAAFAQSGPSPRQAEFAAAAALPPPPNATRPPAPGDTVYFTFKQTYLTKEGVATVQRQAAWLKANPDVRIVLECHTDDDYTPDYALSFGEARCQQVERILLRSGVEAARITAMSLGNQRPAVANASTKEEHARNRRVVTRIVE